MSSGTVGAIIWATVILGFVGAEAWGLRSSQDRFPTFSDIIRSITAGRWRSPVWWLLAGFWGWMGYHFLLA